MHETQITQSAPVDARTASIYGCIGLTGKVSTRRTFIAKVSLCCSKWGVNAPVASVLAVRACLVSFAINYREHVLVKQRDLIFATDGDVLSCVI